LIKKQQLLLNDLLIQRTGNIVSNMDGQKVMLSIQNGKYYNLGEIGGEIWDLLEEPTSVSKMVAILTYEYDIEPVMCEQQVISFMERLLDEGLIQFADQSRE